MVREIPMLNVSSEYFCKNCPHRYLTKFTKFEIVTAGWSKVNKTGLEYGVYHGGGIFLSPGLNRHKALDKKALDS